MPYILPQPQVRQTGWDQAGFASGTVADILLKALLAGQIGKGPIGQGTLGLPGGGRATPGPGLQSQLNAGQLPSLIQSGQFPSGTTYQPKTRFGLQPNIDQQLKQAQLQQTQAYTPYIQSLTNQSQQQVPQTVVSYLAKKALNGDAEADAQLQALGY